MSFSYETPSAGRAALEAYERLIHDVMIGDHTLFTTADGIERLWEVSEPVLEDPPPVESLRARLPGARGRIAPDRASSLAPSQRPCLNPPSAASSRRIWRPRWQSGSPSPCGPAAISRCRRLDSAGRLRAARRDGAPGAAARCGSATSAASRRTTSAPTSAWRGPRCSSGCQPGPRVGASRASAARTRGGRLRARAARRIRPRHAAARPRAARPRAGRALRVALPRPPRVARARARRGGRRRSGPGALRAADNPHIAGDQLGALGAVRRRGRGQGPDGRARDRGRSAAARRLRFPPQRRSDVHARFRRGRGDRLPRAQTDEARQTRRAGVRVAAPDPRQRTVRRLVTTQACVEAAAWAFGIAFSIHAYEVGGATLVGLAVSSRLAGAAAAAPFAGLLADRFGGRRLLIGGRCPRRGRAGVDGG